MPLNPIPSFPSERGYVLRVAANADALRGELEHINSGTRLVFRDANELIRALRAHLAGEQTGTELPCGSGESRDRRNAG